MIYCCMELHLSGVFVDFLYFMKTLYTDQFPKKLEKLAALFFDRFLVTETVTEGLVEPEVVERCRDNYNIELDQQLQEAIRSRLSLATFQGLKAYPKRGKGPYPKKATQKGDFFWADSHPNK